MEVEQVGRDIKKVSLLVYKKARSRSHSRGLRGSKLMMVFHFQSYVLRRRKKREVHLFSFPLAHAVFSLIVLPSFARWQLDSDDYSATQRFFQRTWFNELVTAATVNY